MLGKCWTARWNHRQATGRDSTGRNADRLGRRSCLKSPNSYPGYPYFFQWIGLRENLQETIDVPIKYGAFL